MVAEKITFLQMPNTILQRIISKCKNDKPWKNWIAPKKGVLNYDQLYIVFMYL